MKKETKIRSPFVQQLVEDRENLENIIKDTTKSSLSEILEDTVKNELNKLIKEEDEDEYEEIDDEVKDTTSEEPEEGSDSEEEQPMETDDEEGMSDTEEDDLDTDSDNEEDGWSEFEQYKGDDDTYDFRNADNDTIVKVYKLLKDDDQVFVEKDEEGNTHITDNETGNEYMIVDDSADMEGETGFDGPEVDENTIYEIALNDDMCSESDLGYTDNYQNKTAMTTPPNDNTNTKSARYIDDGVPTGNEKPWPGNAGDMSPFKESKEEENMEEATNVGGFVQQNSTSKSHVPNSKGRDARNASVAGVHTKSTSQPRYTNSVSEDIKRKANALWEENKAMKKELLNIKKSLEEAVVLNYNLGQITKLFTENTTSKEEKINIIKRFGNESKTIEDSKKLYESISKNLKKIGKIEDVSSSVDKQIKENVKNEKSLIETPIYQNKDLTESLSLIKRISVL